MKLLPSCELVSLIIKMIKSIEFPPRKNNA